ncbi:MAG: tetraprenyl-beta-curcumene synthase family protein [Thermoanaerobacteraceae bacterium]|uniref:tetraprenyl-beta-curcumene synthase family protein n=1 Tax=Thermanaeromonas sp. C210 TaxID=2731925 RepID=UPI00155CE4E8|nr:tetraprenyl-beta-curcumene synthase family protein [Thermanaeromonas sp. C210]MBE3581969.1 tetraprenyl-beta-curcumene synthase family protein [Thermoanaerobacteraceae bacterium]GFN22138.1 hypothetical protein TAMC210_04540 [Thermanaeromonas sp. C210]
MPGSIAHLQLMARYLFQSFPGVARELEGWRRLASRCPDPELRRQALASLALKRFHCQGASVFAVWHGNCHGELLRAIVALQTISDYLDNLCDRAGVHEEKAFQQLHHAFRDALTPGANPKDYYKDYPYRQDGGYLAALVKACQQSLRTLPSYPHVQDKVQWLAELYCHLQVTKHLLPDRRERRLIQWLDPLLQDLPEPLNWWELAAATGSTLGIFALMATALRPRVTVGEVEQLTAAYFPWIGGLHILLDYYIDRQEDREGEDLNFVNYYNGEREALLRLQYFLQRSLEEAASLPDPVFHRTVIWGLLALYLSDAKVAAQEATGTRRLLLLNGGLASRHLFFLCSFLRRAGVI